MFTVGHSTHKQAEFLNLLSEHKINALCDVRSQPYSRFNPQFNREELKRSATEKGIAYVFLGAELGARSEDPTCYENGRVQYDKVAQTELFQTGIERVLDGAKDFRIALTCAEKEPLECHRTILVARHLVARGLKVQHIHADGKLESHSDALGRLARMLNLVPQMDMFSTSHDMFDEAYRQQEERIAYKPEPTAPLRAVAGSAAR